MKYSRLSITKLNKIFLCFSQDITATVAAKRFSLKRFSLIRAKRVRGKRGRGAVGKTPVFSNAAVS